MYEVNTKKGVVNLMKKEIPYKIYLEENELPTHWQNLRAFMKNKPAPLLNPETKQPMTHRNFRVFFAASLPSRSLTTRRNISKFPKKFAIFIKCTALRP